MAIKNKRLKLLRGSTYTFDVSDPALANNPLRFTADSGTTEYTDGITLSGANAQGLSGATLTFTVPASAPNNLNYYGDSTSLKMGNHVLIPGTVSGGSSSTSGDYTDSALSQDFFLNAIDAYDSDTNSYSTDNTYLSGNFNDHERIATNGTYTLIGDNYVTVKHTGTGTTGTDTPVGNAGWTWLIRNRDGALMKSWNGIMNGDTVDINTLDLETYYIGGTPYYSKFHTANWGSLVSMTKKYMFISVQYRPTGGSNTSLNWYYKRAYIAVYELTNFTHVHTFALEDFYGSNYIEAKVGAPGSAGGGTGWTENLWFADDENLFVGAYAAAVPSNTNYEEGAVTWWDISDTDPANWSTNPDAVIRNPIDVINNPVTNVGGTNYSNKTFGAYVNFRNNNLVVGHTIWLHQYTKSGSTFTRNNFLQMNNQSQSYASLGTAFMSTDDTNIIISRTDTNPRSFVARDYTNNFSTSWSYSNTNGGYPYGGFRQINAGKDVKVEIAAYPDYWANNKAGAVSFIKTSDRTSVLELDNPFERDSDGLYFGQGLAIAPIDSDNSNRFSMVSWGEPDDNDTKDIISFWELVWDSDTGTLKLDKPKVHLNNTDSAGDNFYTAPIKVYKAEFGDNGNKFYMTGHSADTDLYPGYGIRQQTLPTPYDLSTLDSTDSAIAFDWASSNTWPLQLTYSPAYLEPRVTDFELNDDGTKMWVLQRHGQAYSTSNSYTTSIWGYDLSTPWDISTADWDSSELRVANIPGDSAGSQYFGQHDYLPITNLAWIDHFKFSTNGRKILIYGGGIGYPAYGSIVITYHLDSAFNISSASSRDIIHMGLATDINENNYDSTWLFNNGIGVGGSGSALFSDDGTKLYIEGSSWDYPNHQIGTWNLSTPWDINTATKAFEDVRVNYNFNDFIGFGKDEILIEQYVNNSYQKSTIVGHNLSDSASTTIQYGGPSATITYTAPNGYIIEDRNKIGAQGINEGDSATVTLQMTGTSGEQYGINEGDTIWWKVNGLLSSEIDTPSDGSTTIDSLGQASAFFIPTDDGTTMSPGAEWGAINFYLSDPAAGSSPPINITTTINVADPGHYSYSTPFAWGGTRGVIAAAGATGGSRTKNIEYWGMSTGGTAQTFGNLTVFSKSMSGGMSNNTRIVFGSRETGSSSSTQSLTPTIDYITPATTGDAVDFGDDITSYYAAGAHTSNGTTGLMIAGNLPTGNAYPNNYSDYMKSIRKITIDTTGNATDMGDISKKLYGVAGAGDATRALHAGGVDRTNFQSGSATSTNEIKYISYATPSASYDFGDLNGMGGSQWDHVGGTADATRSIFAGGYVRTNYYNVQQTAYAASANVIHYVTTQTTSNAYDFGDLTYWSYKSGGGCTDGTTAQFAGGFGKLENDPYATVDIIEKITIQTTGNATNFGSITQSNDGSNGAGA